MCCTLGFTGIDSTYEIPPNPDLVLKAGEQTLHECVTSVVKMLKEKVSSLLLSFACIITVFMSFRQ